MPATRTEKTTYLRERPFLLIQIACLPTPNNKLSRVHTEKKGWMRDPKNITFDERPLIVDRISDKHLVEYQVIIDILNQSMVKNSLDHDDIQIIQNSRKRYDDIIERGLHQWALRGGNPREIDERRQRVVAYMTEVASASHPFQPTNVSL